MICLAISGDQENDPDVLAMNGASAAVCLSGIPFEGPVGAVRVGLIDGAFVVNPTNTQQAASTLELVIAGTEDAVLMVESGSREIAEETMLEAIAFGHAECRKLARAQKELVARAGKPRRPFDPSAGRDEALVARVRDAGRRPAPGPRWRPTTSRPARRPSGGSSRRSSRPSASRRTRSGRCARSSRAWRRPRFAG